MVKRIVWSSDGSPSADRALPVVRDLLVSTGASLTVACVHKEWHIGHRPVLVDDHGSLEDRLRQLVDGLTGDGFDADLVLTTNDGGTPAQLIADLAVQLDADMIVAGSHGRGPVAGLFLGSFTGALLKVATCPVLIVPWRPQPADDVVTP
jgi:nucleotide-binding universal stress UspA family protein